MAMTERRILNLMIEKFNDEYTAELNPEDFLIHPIPAQTAFQYGFEALTTFLNNNNVVVRLRMYFNIGPGLNLSKFRLSELDDNDPNVDYVYITEGTIDRSIITDNNAISPLINYDGSGHIDDTNTPVAITMVLDGNDW